MQEKGFTLLEVMITMVIFGIVSASMAGAFVSQAQYNTRSEIRTEAVSAAQQVLDRMRFLDPASLPNSGSETAQQITVGERDFDVVVSYCLEAAYCTSTTTRHITVDVSFNDRTWYSVETVFTRLQ